MLVDAGDAVGRVLLQPVLLVRRQLAAEADDIATAIEHRLLLLTRGQALGHQDIQRQLRPLQLAPCLQRFPHLLVELLATRARGIGQHRPGALFRCQPGIAPGEEGAPVMRVLFVRLALDLDHLAATALDRLQRLGGIGLQGGIDRLLGGRIALADDLGQPEGRHAGLLQLGEGPAGLHRAQLLLVADQQHPGSLQRGPGQQRVHGAGPDQRGLVDDPQLLAGGCCRIPCPPCRARARPPAAAR